MAPRCSRHASDFGLAAEGTTGYSRDACNTYHATEHATEVSTCVMRLFIHIAMSICATLIQSREELSHWVLMAHLLGVPTEGLDKTAVISGVRSALTQQVKRDWDQAKNISGLSDVHLVGAIHMILSCHATRNKSWVTREGKKMPLYPHNLRHGMARLPTFPMPEHPAHRGQLEATETELHHFWLCENHRVFSHSELQGAIGGPARQQMLRNVFGATTWSQITARVAPLLNLRERVNCLEQHAAGLVDGSTAENSMEADVDTCERDLAARIGDLEQRLLGEVMDGTLDERVATLQNLHTQESSQWCFQIPVTFDTFERELSLRKISSHFKDLKTFMEHEQELPLISHIQPILRCA